MIPLTKAIEAANPVPAERNIRPIITTVKSKYVSVVGDE